VSRIAFFGTSAFGAEVLRALASMPGVAPSCVVSQPDRPSGRGRREQAPPVVETARELGIEVRQAGDASADPPAADAGAVVAFGQLVRPPLLGAYPLYNLHPSLLPRWGGAAPVERAIMAGDRETGVAVIELVQELDAGPVHGMARIAIGPGDDAGAVRRRALELGVPLLAAALRGETTGAPQAAEGLTYAAKIGAADREIDWARPAAAVDALVRALSPHIGARTRLDGRPITIWRARPAAVDSEPGVVTAPLVVGCGAGALEVLELQAAGGRRMAAADYLRGLRRPPSRAA
jgi:methionyl-tRNA formyltransferase